MDEENRVKELKEKLAYAPKHASYVMDADGVAAADAFCEGYMSFLDEAKTEREAVKKAIELAKSNGFREYARGHFYGPGEKIYYNNRGKSVVLAVMGEVGLSEGARVVAAHIDSPRLDLKPTPLYEKDELACLKTHYYGGIKKYQWTAIPLALHGVIVLADGKTVEVRVGEEPGDPVFTITDLLPHLAGEQMGKTLAAGITGEELNVLVGSRPFADTEEAENVKLNVLNILFEKYGMTEADFISAELELVPAFKAADVGFDRSMIGAYGQDDRVCAYPALMGVLDAEEPLHTTVCVLTDKEETGSMGNTGLDSDYLFAFIRALAKSEGLDPDETLSKSVCLSADVNAAFDPDYASQFDHGNVCFLNRGVVLTKYTGARGKNSTNDASAETMGRVRRMLDEAGVCWQTGEIGRVDAGGGGTVARFVAGRNIDVVDLGVPLLSMHAPFEIVAKLDVYALYQACVEFYRS